MKLNLPDEIISGEDLRSVIEELKDYQSFIRHGQIKSHVSKRSSGAGPELSSPAAALLSIAMERHPLNLEVMDNLISELQKMYSSSPKLKIILAAVPNHAIKKQIATWIRQNTNQDALIDFSYNQSLLGGMVVTVGSHIFDWSLRRGILAEQPKLNEMIAHV